MPCFQGKTTPLSEQIQYNLALSNLNQFNPITEDFTEGFDGHFWLTIGGTADDHFTVREW